jgi:hypothetical protein
MADNSMRFCRTLPQWPSHHYQIEMIAPNRENRRTPTQDGRPLRRYKRRWKVERLFAWLFNFRRLVVRYEYHAANFQGFVHLAAAYRSNRTLAVEYLPTCVSEEDCQQL